MQPLLDWFKGLTQTNQIIVAGIPLAILFYLIVSPYQNCMRERDNIYYCSEVTKW